MMLGLLAWPTVADKQKSAEMPAIAFLEFLAEMQEVDGELVSASDLLELNQQVASKQQAAATEEQLAVLKLLNDDAPAVEKALATTDKSQSASGTSNSPAAARKNTSQTNKDEDKQ